MVVVAVELMGAAPPVEETHAVADSADNGTGISWERSVRLELCILTANERDDKSAGNGVSSDRRVMVNEHNLANGMSQITIKHEQKHIQWGLLEHVPFVTLEFKLHM